MIELTGVSKQFDGKRRVTALADVNLAIARGELVSIVGPSGSGKSTLLNLIGGLDRPTTGEIAIDGQRLGGLSDDELTLIRRDKLGFIFQFFNLLPSLSCLENVALPLHLRGWPRRKAVARARELLRARPARGAARAHAGRTLRRRAPANGHRPGARRSIRRSCWPTNRPATSTRVTGAEILDLIRDLHGRLGATVLIVTHDLTVAGSCPRTLTIRDGRVVGDERR